jgi:hypothetical protein
MHTSSPSPISYHLGLILKRVNGSSLAVTENICLHHDIGNSLVAWESRRVGDEDLDGNNAMVDVDGELNVRFSAIGEPAHR